MPSKLTSRPQSKKGEHAALSRRRSSRNFQWIFSKVRVDLWMVLIVSVALIKLPWFQSNLETKEEFSGSIFSNQTSEASLCHVYLAPSSIPNGGLGVFTTTNIPRGGQIGGNTGMCIQVNIPQTAHHLFSHTHGTQSWFWGTEGVAKQYCPGVATIFNTQMEKSNTLLTSIPQPTHGGLKRDESPGAGAETHFYGVHKFATKDIAAGSEITYDYGGWDLEEEETKLNKKSVPYRTLDFLRSHGMCMDNIVVKRSTIGDAGRGAFASRIISDGGLVAPAPLLILPDISHFQSYELILNYVFKPEGLDILLAPYGEGVNFINHASDNRRANVGLRWSKSEFHHAELLDRVTSEDYDSFIRDVWAGALILEYFALRTIQEGEELLLDYGSLWEQAWKQYVRQWTPKTKWYDYPEDIDNTEKLRTVSEQQENPYAPNLATVCLNAFWEEGPFVHEYEEPDSYECQRKKNSCRCWCHVVSRKFDEKEEEDLYSVLLTCQKGYVDASVAIGSATKQKLTRVPRHAIRLENKPYRNDQFLKQAFRHPIGLPKELFSSTMKI